MLKKYINKIIDFLKKPVIRNILVVISITSFIKFIGFFKETVVASEFGLSIYIDTFLIASIIPGFISTVFLNSFANVFIPNYIANEKANGSIKSFQSSSFLITFACSTVFFIIAITFTDIYLENFIPGHTNEYYALVKKQFRYISPCILIWGLSSLLTGLLNIKGEFKFSSFGPIFIPLTILFFLKFNNNLINDDLVLAISTLIGSILTFIFLLSICLYKKTLSLGKIDFKNKNIVTMLREFPLKISSSLLTGLIPVVDQYFAAMLVIGSVAAINYGLKIPAFILGFSMVGLGNVLLPHFSKLINEDINKAYEHLFKVLKYLFSGALVVVILLIIFSPTIVKLLFERNEFTASDTYKVSNIQMILLAYIPFYLCGNVLVKFLTSTNKNKFMAKISLFNLILSVILDYILMKSYGVYGIVLATTIVYSISPFIYLNFSIKEYKKIRNA
ncbi:polysaccharide biosynthesis C-terminal domain-containing protein [Cellulophaga baltica]|uniref:murein biosynthesis integral membrane protein MurJ n=1 Tax=Cellulophaga TaxID=104264 RepID=UPI001C07DA40|nr:MULTISPECIES: lipid II flippase MurJ [Cellulophaga]MBU2996743.1 polysaccharide biosynthesis C-terminal domain-containing protein [Cellulophaga baltica]MDO6768139.1 lipid II flippase MurJ [Cellulophaga sp. 1_MG-2023]